MNPIKRNSNTSNCASLEPIVEEEEDLDYSLISQRLTEEETA